jgi:hypothetical protein
MPSIQRITDQQLKGRFDRAPMSTTDVKKDGSTQLPPRNGPTDQGFEAWPSKGSNRRPRSTESGMTRARAFEPILEPTSSRAPHMSCSRANEGSLSRDPTEGELPRPRSPANGTEPYLAHPRKRFHGRVSGPRAYPYRTGHRRPLEPPDNSSKRNLRFATRSMGVADASPPVPRRDGEGTYGKVGEPVPIASNGPKLGGSTRGYTSWICTECTPMSTHAYGATEAG